MSSPHIVSVLAQAQRYKILPSEVMNLTDEYTAFCFNEACALIMTHLDKGEKPQFSVSEKPKHYRSLSEYYASLNG